MPCTLHPAPAPSTPALYDRSDFRGFVPFSNHFVESYAPGSSADIGAPQFRGPEGSHAGLEVLLLTMQQTIHYGICLD